MDRPTLSVIIVSWNVRELLARALDSVFASVDEDVELEVIVVDNASGDGSARMVSERFPQVRVIANQQNLGFPAANNQGLALASGDYVLLLNSDTEVRTGALTRMIAHMVMHPETGLAGPKLLNADGSIQSSRRRFPTLRILFLESTWLQPLAGRRALARYTYEDIPATMPQDVDWVTGAAMMARRQAIDQVGAMDEGFFMYSEELDWCRRIRNAGWRVTFAPQAEIVHYGGKSSEQVAPARHIYFQSSKVRYARKYHGSFVAEVLRLWLLWQYLWQMAVEALKWMVGHRRDLRVARVSAYWAVVRSGLR